MTVGVQLFQGEARGGKFERAGFHDGGVRFVKISLGSIGIKGRCGSFFGMQEGENAVFIGANDARFARVRCIEQKQKLFALSVF